jgi:predicted MPP superfamily phosphohydrolase
MQSALPKYAVRVPLLAVLFVVDLLVLMYLSKLWQNLGKGWKLVIQIFWWFPFAILVLFLFGSVAIPLASMNKFLRIYLPGIAIIFFLVKTVLIISLIPAFILSILRYGIWRFKDQVVFSGGINFFKKMGIFLGSLALAGLLVGSTVWVYKFKTHRIELSVKNLPDAFEGLRIVQLSDIHLGSWLSNKPLQRAVDQVNELNPDIIVFTGDMVNYSTSEVRGFENVLAQLKAPLGIYAILGNHDYGDYVSWKTPDEKEENLRQMVDFFDSLGWKLLRNSTAEIEKDSATLLIAGVENWSATSRFKKYGDLEMTMTNVSYGDLNILLSHDPTHWETEVSKDYTQFDLTLSGHTHGMQMGIEAFGLKWSPARYLYDNWAGLASVDLPGGRKSYLYVNRGLGHIAYPGRLGILPEITLLTFSREK